MSTALPGRVRGLRRRRRPLARPRPTTAIRPGEPMEIVAIATSVFMMIGLVCVWGLIQLLFLSGMAQSRTQSLLYSTLRHQLAAGTAPTGGDIAPGAPVALLTIPHLGLQQVVVEGTASGDLEAGPGHVRTSVLPGQAGTSYVFGRSHTYGAPFAQISGLSDGEQIAVQNQQGYVSYRVIGVRRAGDPMPTPPTGSQSLLTLVTLEGNGGGIGALATQHEVYVDAWATKAYPASASRPLLLPASERVLARDTSALPMLVLCLALLVAITYLVMVVRRRFHATHVWVVGVPVVLAAAWMTTDVAVRLLPNLL